MIVQDALEELLIGLKVKTHTEVSRGDIIVGDTQAMKDSNSFNNAREEDILAKLFEKK